MYQINNKDFQILEKYRIFLQQLDDILENVPRRDLYYKDLIRKIAHESLYDVLYCSYETDINKIQKFNVRIKTDFSMIDFMIERLYTKKYIAQKAAYRLSTKLAEINRMVSGWINNMVANGSKFI